MMLHWLVAALIIGNILLIWSVDFWPDAAVRPVIDMHKSIGITVLGLAVLRVLWRLANPPPPMPVGYRRWERRAAHGAHLVLYALIFCLPLSGWLHDSAWKDAATHPMFLFGLFEWPRIGAIGGFDPATQDRLHDALGVVHTAFGYVLYGLLALHVVGALKHQLWDGQAELQRMWPGRRALPSNGGD
jgi:cytochrome b561